MSISVYEYMCLWHSGYSFDMPQLPEARVFWSSWPMFPWRIIEHYTLARTSRDLHLEKQQPRGGKNSREIFEWHVKVAYGHYIQTCTFLEAGKVAVLSRENVSKSVFI